MSVLVFDFGASSARAVLAELENGALSMREIHRFPNTPLTVNGTLYWDIDTLLREVETALEKAEPYGYSAVSVDTWGVDFAILDEQGNFVEKPVHYRDRRTEAVIDEVNAMFGGAEALYRRTGIQPVWFNTIYQLFALKKARPESLTGNVRFLMMPDLICHFLTGAFRNEISEASTTSLLNPQTQEWDRELLKVLGIRSEIFCPTIRSGEIYGFLKPQFCRRKMKIPVVAVPSHDTASAVAAVPAEEDEFVFISTGTWALFGTELKTPVISGEAFRAGLTNERGHGGTVTLLKNIMGMWLLQECRRDLEEKGERMSFSEMEQAARSAEPFLAFVDPNDESFSRPGEMLEKIAAYLRKTGQPVPDTAGLLRAVYDSLAAEFSVTLKSIERITGKRYAKVYMFGGGTKDALLCRLTADLTGRTVAAGPHEATAAGSALCAFAGLGELESVRQGRALVRAAGLTHVYEPDPGVRSEEIREKYQKSIGRKGV